MMPIDLVLVRHALSLENAVREGAERITSAMVEALLSQPSYKVDLMPQGRRQVDALREWIVQNIGAQFDAYWTSPHVRAFETARLLGLPDARWEIKEDLAERNKGLFRKDTVERSLDPLYRAMLELRSQDPFNWVPLGGESLDQVLDRRVRPNFAELDRLNVNRAILVSHGGVMSLQRKEIENWSVERHNQQYLKRDPADWVHTASILWYSRHDPEAGDITEDYCRVLQVCPWQTESPSQTGWRRICRKKYYTNDELRQLAAATSGGGA